MPKGYSQSSGYVEVASSAIVSQKTDHREARLPDFIEVEKGLGPEGRIAVVRFDRGDGINALSPEAIRQLTAVARSFEDDADTSVVVLTGSTRAFSAGFDLKDPEGRSRRTMDIGALRQHLKLGPKLSRAWQEMEQVTICAIEGFCIGGGVALAVALDFRILASDAHLLPSPISGTRSQGPCPARPLLPPIPIHRPRAPRCAGPRCGLRTRSRASRRFRSP
jgi:hypothetical protein